MKTANLVKLILTQVAAALIGVFAACLVLNVAIGVPTSTAISTLFNGAFGSTHALGQTTVQFIPLALTGLAVALPMRMRLWNIGAEGQFYAGAIGVSAVALNVGGLSTAPMLVVLAVAGMASGVIWALLAAIPRAIWGVNEIITTLLLNYIAIQLAAYLVVGPLQGKQAPGYPITDPFPDAAHMPLIGGGPVSIAVIFVLVAAVAIYALLRFTRSGFEIKMLGASPDTSRVVGISATKNTVLVFGLAGALGGLAGMVQVVGSFGALQQDISPGYGYMAVIIAALAGANLLGTLVLAFLFGGFIVGGLALQTADVPEPFVDLLQGIVLFAAIIGAHLAGLRLTRCSPRKQQTQLTPDVPAGEPA
jgi:ABC-type uncharacterized transport system permease subunit